MPRVRRRVALAFAVLLTTVVLFWLLRQHIRAAQFLEQLGRAPAGAEAVTTLDLTIPGKNGPFRARLYRPAGAGALPAVVVAHGVHYRGIDERRLVPFARALAATGLTVLTPELRDLADYRITSSGVDVMKDAVTYLAARHDLVSSDRVRLLGFSFAGGLALVAAEDEATRRHLSAVVSVGGHHDLRRVLHFLIHDEIETPSGILHRKAHEYGLVLLIYGNLEHFVPASDLGVMRDGFRAWLQEDRKRARDAAARCTTPEGERLWQLLEHGKLQTLAPDLDALLATQQAELAALSPAGHLKQLQLPVYLLHGSHDSVIPPEETSAADRELGDSAHDALVSPLLEHVEVTEHASLMDELRLIAFMTHIL